MIRGSSSTPLCECSNGLNPREGIITVARDALGGGLSVRSNGLNPREGIITLHRRYAKQATFSRFKWLKSSGGDYYSNVQLSSVALPRSEVQMA